jgi:hypothetical protein
MECINHLSNGNTNYEGDIPNNEKRISLELEDNPTSDEELLDSQTVTGTSAVIIRSYKSYMKINIFF